MAEHEVSIEASYLSSAYESLLGDVTEWVAIIGSDVVDRDEDPIALTERVDAEHGPGVALFAVLLVDETI